MEQKMTSLESLFPLPFIITEDIIKRSFPLNPNNCVGANSLREALGDFANGRDIFWGEVFGEIDGLRITTEEKVDMLLVLNEIKVTFITAKSKLK